MATTRSPHVRTLLAASESLVSDLAHRLLTLLRARMRRRRVTVVDLSSPKLFEAHGPLRVRTTPRESAEIRQAICAARERAKGVFSPTAPEQPRGQSPIVPERSASSHGRPHL